MRNGMKLMFDWNVKMELERLRRDGHEETSE